MIIDDEIPDKLQGIYYEKLMRSDYENRNNYTESKLVPGLLIKGDDTIVCPRCRCDNGCVVYGEATCKKCKLGLFVRCKDLYIFDSLEKNT